MKLLLIEDNPADARLISEYLSEAFTIDFFFEHSSNLTDAVSILSKIKFDIIITDLGLPESNGLETFNIIKNKSLNIPIIVLTGNQDEELGLEAVKNGAEDFVFKNIIDQFLLRRVINHAIERNYIKNELKIAKEYAEKVSKSKDEFLANMSHELRTPLNSILGFTQILLEEVNNPEYLDMLRIVFKSSNILLSHINDLLDLAKIDSGKVELKEIECNLVEIIRKSINQLQTEAKIKNLQIIFNWDQNSDKIVIADELKFHQIVTNLISNAIKYTERGHIEVSISMIKEESKHELAKIDVKDTGIGIANENLGVIFEKFSRIGNYLTNSSIGTGLGLSIVNQLVNLMNGEISVKSELGVGSTFSIVLPLKKNLNKTEANTNNKLLKLLVVEDNEANCILIENILMSQDLDFKIVKNGNDALHYYESGNFNFVLLDLQLPDISGFEVAKKIVGFNRSMNKDSKIIALTAYNFEGIIEQCYKSGIDDILYKPYTTTKLLSKIRQN